MKYFVLFTFFVSIIFLGMFWPNEKDVARSFNPNSCLRNLDHLGHIVLFDKTENNEIPKGLQDLLEIAPGIDIGEFECPTKIRPRYQSYHFFSICIYKREIELNYKTDYKYIYHSSLKEEEKWIVCYCLNHKEKVPVFFSSYQRNLPLDQIVTREEFDLLFEKQKKELDKNGIKCTIEEGIINTE